MKNYRILWAVYLNHLLLSFCTAQSQETELLDFNGGNQAEYLEKLNEREDDKDLEKYVNHPLDLNHENFESILAFPLFDKQQAELVNAYLKTHRPLKSVYELQTIDGLPLEILKRSLPYFTLKDSMDVKGLLKIVARKNTHKLVFRWGRTIEINKQMNAGRFLGSPDKFYCRYKSAVPGSYSFALTMEKDAGEPWFQKKGPKGFDYSSAYVEIEHPVPWLKKIILGDYQMCIGQGLLIDNSFTIENADALSSSIKRSGLLKPYQSIRESDMFRGIGMNIKLPNNTTALVYYSSVKQDARLSLDVDPIKKDTSLSIGSILSTSYHRDSNELETKNKLAIEVKGISLNSNIRTIKIGVNVLKSSQQYPWDVLKRPDRNYINTSNPNFQFSIDHNYTYKKISLYGEIAMDQKKQKAWMETLLILPSSKMELRIHIHSFDRGFYKYYSNANTASGLSFNEHSFQLSWFLKLNAGCNITGNAHFTAYPWLRYQESHRSNGSKFLIKIQCSERKKWSAYLLAQSDFEEQNHVNTKNKQDELIFQKNYQLRMNLDLKISNSLVWRSRIEARKSVINSNSGTGFLISTDFLYKNFESKLSGNVRYAAYRIPEYENRIYSFQNDVSGIYNLTSYSGNGYSIYLNLRCRLTTQIILECRWGGQFNQIEGSNIGISKTHDIKFQLQYKF